MAANRKPLHSKPATLHADHDWRESFAALSKSCAVMQDIIARHGRPPPRDQVAGFEGLAEIVVSQQLSGASAAAIWRRVKAAVRPFTPKRLLSRTDQELQSAGLSSGKIKTLRALAAAVAARDIDFAVLDVSEDAEIIAHLTKLHGIGPWTADIYLLFALQRADAFAAGDLALQIAVQRHFNLKSRPSAAELLKIAERWRPWRSIAARLLWMDYTSTIKTKQSEPALAAKAGDSTAKRVRVARKNRTKGRNKASKNPIAESKLHRAVRRR